MNTLDPSRESLVVLVIEDAVDVRTLTAALLEEKGYQVVTAGTAAEALRLLDERVFDVVLLDVNLPDGTGEAILARIRRGPRLIRLPVIVISASRDAEYDMVDVFDYLHKPVDFGRLFDDLQYIEARRRLEGPFCAPVGGSHEEEDDSVSVDCAAFGRVLREQVGLNIPSRRHGDLVRAVSSRVRALLRPSVDSYRRYIESPEGEDELKKLVLLLTVGETYFFRNSGHFSVLLETILPQIKERLTRQEQRRSVRILSAGCSTGEEAYSLAIEARDVFPSAAGWQVQVVGVDINNRSLNVARRAVYGKSSFRGVDPRIQERHFRPQKGGTWAVSPEIRSMVEFDYVNLRALTLARPPASLSDLDLIFCRNVLIYFDEDTIQHVLAGFHCLLRPDGYVFLGHAESSLRQAKGFEVCFEQGVFYFRRVRIDQSSHRVEAPSVATEVERTTGVDFDHEIRRGFEFYDDDRIDQARQAFERVLKVDPDCHRARVGLAFILASQGQEDRALAEVEEALRQQVGIANGYFLRASLRERSGTSLGVIEDYQRAVLWDPGFVMARINLGFAAERLGRFELALEAFTEVVAILQGDAAVSADCRLSGGLNRSALVALAQDKVRRMA